MGKIAALGGGCFENGEVAPILDRIFSLCGKKDPALLYLPTAGFDDMSDAPSKLEAFERLGARTSSLLLTDSSLSANDISNSILSADIIYVGGGNLKFLMETWVRTDALGALRRAYGNGTVLCGQSSGAMCWFNMGWDDCGENHEYMFVPCMGLLPFCCCPHFESENWHRFTDEVHLSGLSGIAAEDGAALIYDDGKYSVINGTDGGDVYFLDKGSNYTCIRLDAEASQLN